MTDLKFQPVRHDHKAFLEKASKRRGFNEAYETLELEYALASEMLAARTRAGLTQEAVACRMGTTKSAIPRLESAGKHAPSVASLKRYAEAVGCTLKIELVSADRKRRKNAKPDLHKGRSVDQEILGAVMKIDYDQTSDILSMLFSSTPVEESDEVKPGVILDYDAAGNVVGIEILDASRRMENPTAVELSVKAA